MRTSSADNLLEPAFYREPVISDHRATIAGKKETKYERLMRERLYGFGQINAVDC